MPESGEITSLLRQIERTRVWLERELEDYRYGS